DKGSNVRSKGRDGYTPIGVDLIDARQIDQARLRVRTWVNGTLAQEGGTEDLLFPLGQFVTDLSQHLTLEAGDVILTGTPAGSSVVRPGDTVEVEVDSPGTGHSSGRLRTKVAQDDAHAFDPEVGSLPAVDDAQRIAAWGSEEAAGLDRRGLHPQLREKLQRTPVATLSQQLRRRGLNNVAIDGVGPLPGSGKIVGTAATLRFVPNREDLFKSYGGGYNAQNRAFDALGEGEVMIIEARGYAPAGTPGDALAMRAGAIGAAGIIADGAVRAYQAVAEVNIPVFSAGAHPAVLGRRHVPWEYGVTVACGGATVQPGDIIVADTDGAVVIPPAYAEEVVEAALAKEDEDAWLAGHVGEG